MSFKITNVDTGEIQIVESTDGYDPKVWTSEKIKKIRIDQVFDGVSNKVVKLQKQKKLPVSLDELKELIREVVREELNNGD